MRPSREVPVTQNMGKVVNIYYFRGRRALLHILLVLSSFGYILEQAKLEYMYTCVNPEYFLSMVQLFFKDDNGLSEIAKQKQISVLKYTLMFGSFL